MTSTFRNVSACCNVKSQRSSISIPPGYASVSVKSTISVLRKVSSYFSMIPVISMHSLKLFSFKSLMDGWVAEHNTTSDSAKLVRKFTAKLKSSIHFFGMACTSSKMITLLHKVCILRISLFCPEKSTFNTCTADVIIIGTSHVSVSFL